MQLDHTKAIVITDNEIEIQSIPSAIKSEYEEVLYHALYLNHHPDMRDYKNIHSYSEDGINYKFNIKLGSFTESHGKYDLEVTYASFEEIIKDMLIFSLGENQDILYTPYIEIETEDDGAHADYIADVRHSYYSGIGKI